MPIQVTAAYEAAKKLSEIVAFVVKIKGELTKKPKLAARDLATALDHIYATFQAVASEVAAFLALGASVDALKERAPMLSQLQGVVLRTRVRNAKGHCTVIGNIYKEHLDDWFRGSLSKVDYLMAKTDFVILGEADEVLFNEMLSVCDAISTEARAVEDLTLEGKWDAARARVLESRKNLREMERVLGDTMDQLSDLKVEFLGISGAPNVQGT